MPRWRDRGKRERKGRWREREGGREWQAYHNHKMIKPSYIYSPPDWFLHNINPHTGDMVTTNVRHRRNVSDKSNLEHSTKTL